MAKKTTSRPQCCFCRKHQNDVTKLICGPGVYICKECVQQRDRLLLAEDDTNLKCSFCRKPQALVKMLLTSTSSFQSVCICDECMNLCHEIMSDEIPASPVAPSSKGPGSQKMSDPQKCAREK